MKNMRKEYDGRPCPHKNGVSTLNPWAMTCVDCMWDHCSGLTCPRSGERSFGGEVVDRKEVIVFEQEV